MIQRYSLFWCFRRGSRNSFSITFCVWFLKKNVSYVIFYKLTKFHRLIAFASWHNTSQYVYCNCLLTRLRCHKFWNYLIFQIKRFLYMIRKSKQKFKYLENEASLWGEIKSIFHHFQRDFKCQKFSQTWECRFNVALFPL